MGDGHEKTCGVNIVFSAVFMCTHDHVHVHVRVPSGMCTRTLLIMRKNSYSGLLACGRIPHLGDPPSIPAYRLFLRRD